MPVTEALDALWLLLEEAPPSQRSDQLIETILQLCFAQCAAARDLPADSPPISDTVRAALGEPDRDIARLGAAYEVLMGVSVERAEGLAIALKPDDVVIHLDTLLAQPPRQRAAWLRKATGCTLSRAERTAIRAATTPQHLSSALERKTSARTPRPLPEGTRFLQPGLARRRSGSHYTPRAVTEALVAATIGPLLGPSPTPEQILGLTVCDPSMGAGAFLLAAGRMLSDALVAASESITKPEARRLVARRCLHGVDRDPVAVSLARRSLWLWCGDAALPLPALDENLREGDALVGLSSPEVDDPVAADLQIAAFFDGGSTRERARLREAYGALSTGSEAAAEIRRRMHTRPLHWPLAFPAVFSRADPGFDAIIGNPPFRNAIEATTARDPIAAAYFQRAFPVFAKGAYDYCLLFWARLDTLLRSGGRYGMLSPTVLLSSGKPWQRWMHQHLRPDSILLLPSDRFDDARIRTVGLAGGRGAAEAYRVDNRDDLRPEASFTRRWDPRASNWFEATRPDAVRLGGGPLDIVALSALAEVSAGCTTGGAYALKPLIVDALDGGGPRLVTTGAIDRYVCKWGQMAIRYLKDDYTHPRWPSAPDIPRAVGRARDGQAGPKILVGGLTAVIEAWLDEAGDSAGTVQTWVIRPRAVATRYVLLGLLNSATFTRLFMQKFGAGAMSGAQTTIKKAALLASPLPAVSAEALGAPIDALLDPAVPVEGLSAAVLAAALDRVARVLQAGVELPGLDYLAHVLAARLFGRTLAEAEDDYRYWAERDRRDAVVPSLDALRSAPGIRAALSAVG